MGGWPSLRAWLGPVRTRNLNMFTLIAMGTGIAWLFSVIATVAPGIFPASFRGDAGTVDVYLRPLPSSPPWSCSTGPRAARPRTDLRAIKAPLDLTPKTARRITNSGDEEEVALDMVQPGIGWQVRPARRPRRRDRREGRSAVDESLVTGESMPATKTSGDTVIGGTINAAAP